MRRPTARGCAGALVAIAVVIVATVVPGTMADLPLGSRVQTFISAACGGPSPCHIPAPSAPRHARAESAAPPSFIEHLQRLRELEAVLKDKMPGVPAPDRTQLAGAILDEAKRASLDPMFVLAVIAVESRFDHDAESHQGAVGLMQLRPSTLRREAVRSQLDMDDLDDPVLNVRAGVRYFGRLLRAFGSTDLALMAYNAGPNRILRYLREDGDVPERFNAYPERIREEHGKLNRRYARRLAPPRPSKSARVEAREAPAAPTVH